MPYFTRRLLVVPGAGILQEFFPTQPMDAKLTRGKPLTSFAHSASASPRTNTASMAPAVADLLGLHGIRRASSQPAIAADELAQKVSEVGSRRCRENVLSTGPPSSRSLTLPFILLYRRILSSYLMLPCASCRLTSQAKVLGPEVCSGGDWRSSQIRAVKPRCFSMFPGITLPEGWRASVKVRITTRRGGRPGRTTTNTYYSPSGKAYRSHGAVLDALRGIEGGTVPGSEAPSEAPSDTESVPPSPKRIRL